MSLLVAIALKHSSSAVLRIPSDWNLCLHFTFEIGLVLLRCHFYSWRGPLQIRVVSVFIGYWVQVAKSGVA